MTEDRTYNQRPQSLTLRIILGLTISVIVYLLIAGTTFNPTLLAVVIVALVLILNFYGESQFFDGLSVKSETVEVSKNSIFNGKVEHQLNFKDILKITFVKGMHRTPQHIIIESEMNPSKLKVRIGESILKFAYILRELKRNNIEVKLLHFDHEVQLFLDEEFQNFQ